MSMPMQDETGVERPLQYLRSVLIPTETLEAWAVQRRAFALSHRRQLVAATSGRLVVITRHLLGGFDVADVRWQDLEEVTLRVGVFGASLAIRAGNATDLASQGAAGTRRLVFEGLRARSGGFQMSPANQAAGGQSEAVRRLQEAKQMLDARLITDSEYEAIKAKI